MFTKNPSTKQISSFSTNITTRKMRISLLQNVLVKTCNCLCNILNYPNVKCKIHVPVPSVTIVYKF